GKVMRRKIYNFLKRRRSQGEKSIVSQKVVITLPIHPIMFALYGFLLFPLFMYSPIIFASLSSYLGVSSSAAAALGLLMPTLSFPLSLVNVVVKRIETEEEILTYDSKYITFMGFPIPVFIPVLQRKEITIAVNLGGAVLPIFFSTLLIIAIGRSSSDMLIRALLDVAVTSIVTFFTSRAVPRVGIVTPSLIPPIVSTLAAFLLGGGHFTFPIAYIGGVLGSLIGADVLRLMKDIDKFKSELGSAFLSIGGAGTFDGIFLSGIFAAVFSAIL
ncbi:MAG: DUF1614 domain-containing protein, partial [Fervidicoccaceae archaeon]